VVSLRWVAADLLATLTPWLTARPTPVLPGRAALSQLAGWNWVFLSAS